MYAGNTWGTQVGSDLNKILDFEREYRNYDRAWDQQRHGNELAAQREQQLREDTLQRYLLGENLTFDREQLGENRRQFDENLGFEREQFNTTNARRDAFLQMLGLSTGQSQSMGMGNMEFGEPMMGTMDSVPGSFGGALDNILGTNPSSGYTDLLNEQRQITDQLLGQVDQFGQSQRAALNRGFDSQLGSTIANMEQRGLGASNLMGSATAAVEAERQQASLNLEDQLLGRKIDTMQQQYGDIFNTMRGEMDRELARRQSGTGLLGTIAGTLF